MVRSVLSICQFPSFTPFPCLSRLSGGRRDPGFSAGSGQSGRSVRSCLSVSVSAVHFFPRDRAGRLRSAILAGPAGRIFF
jgi:hypothetical protein